MTRRLFAVLALAWSLSAVPPAISASAKSDPAVKNSALSPEEIAGKMEALFDADEDGEVVVSPERFTEILRSKLGRLDQLAAEFRRKFPEHPLRWKVLLCEALNLPLRMEAGLPAPAGKTAASMFAEILASADAPEDVKSDASVQRLMIAADDVGAKKMTVDEWEKWLARHWKDFPEAGDNAAIEELHIGLIQELAPARLDALLAGLAKHTDSAIADMAKEKQAAQKAMAEMRSKPLDLKFKALDGTEVDVAKLRGKVVLIDFWATWCGPCMAALPEVAGAYEKLHGSGFEIIGISLDDDAGALKRVMKSKRIVWPQFFDGRGWESEIARRFGIDGIPTMWLVNRDGMISDTDAGVGLAEKVMKLLDSK